MSEPNLIQQSRNILDNFSYAITECAKKPVEAETLFNTRQQDIEVDFARSEKRIEETFNAEKNSIENEYTDKQKVSRDKLDKKQRLIELELDQKKREIGSSFSEWLTINRSSSGLFPVWSITFQFWSIWCSTGLLLGVIGSLVAIPWIGYPLWFKEWLVVIYSVVWCLGGDTGVSATS